MSNAGEDLTRTKDVFLSHSSGDLAWAEWIADVLGRAGISVELDAWDFRPGADFALTMERGVRNARAVLAVLTPAYLAGRYTAPEWAMAFRRDPQGQGGVLVPVRVVSLDDEGFLGGRSWIDLVGLEESAAAVELVRRVRQALDGGSARPPGPRPFPGVPSPATRALFPGALPPIWNIPRPRAGFVGRSDEMSLLDRSRTGAVALTHEAIVGLGGVGKSSLARAWAHRNGAEWMLGWWLRAEQPAVFDDDLLGLGFALGLLDPTSPPQDRAAALGAVREWLRSPTPAPKVPAGRERWVLVVDNAGDPASVELPTGPGVVVVTSRDRRWERTATGVRVTTLPPDACRELLRAGLSGPGNEPVEADAVATLLGHLPLALAQAHAWCHEHGQTLAGCRERLGRSSTVLQFAAGTGEATVATTWALAVEGLPVVARAVLEVLAFFGPEDVPAHALFEDDASVDDEALSPELRSLCGDPEALDRSLLPLHRSCLVERNGDRLSVHRLVQRVSREGLTAEARAGRLAEARTLLRRAMPSPDDPAGWPLWRRLVPHLESLATDDEQPVDSLIGQAASFLRTQAEYAAALRLERRALAITERALGPEHPSTALRLGNLAATLWELGEHAAARPLEERALAITERALGPEHPSTAIRLGNLAETLSGFGEHAAARPMQERALAITERALGPEHPTTALWLGNLAATLSALGEHAAARPMKERALAISERALGPEHPSTAIRLGNLAETLYELGEYAAARPMQERALAITERALGPEHPSTANRLGNLAETLSELGEHAAARPMQERALAITERALGPEHPTTAIRLGNLGATLSALGEHAAARPLEERALAISERALGPEHPSTAIRLGNLGVARLTLGEHKAARDCLERAVSILERRLGANHPTTRHWKEQLARLNLR